MSTVTNHRPSLVSLHLPTRTGERMPASAPKAGQGSGTDLP